MSEKLCALLVKLWQDDRGSIIATEYLMLASVVALGSVGGLTAVRDAANEEMAEYGQNMRAIRQSYSVPPVQSRHAARAGSSVVDAPPSNALPMP